MVILGNEINEIDAKRFVLLAAALLFGSNNNGEIEVDVRKDGSVNLGLSVRKPINKEAVRDIMNSHILNVRVDSSLVDSDNLGNLIDNLFDSGHLVEDSNEAVDKSVNGEAAQVGK